MERNNSLEAILHRRLARLLPKRYQGRAMEAFRRAVAIHQAEGDVRLLADQPWPLDDLSKRQQHALESLVEARPAPAMNWAAHYPWQVRAPSALEILACLQGLDRSAGTQQEVRQSTENKRVQSSSFDELRKACAQVTPSVSPVVIMVDTVPPDVMLVGPELYAMLKGKD